MKKVLIVALVCINIMLVAVLINANATTAQAQTERGANNYILVTGRVDSGIDAVYVIDLRTRKMGAWRFDRVAKRMLPYRGQDLKANFGGRP